MAPATNAKIIATITEKQWSGRPAKDAGHQLLGGVIMMVVVCLFLMIFIPPLRNIGAVFTVSAVSALALTIFFVVTDMQREKRFFTNLTETVNEFIVESTGDRSSRITAARLRELLEFSGKLPLSINGVPCLELKSSGDRRADRQIVATVTAPDYGLDSFDRLLMEEAKRSA
jgi:hypothetical protein